jgi:hypothetical protein
MLPSRTRLQSWNPDSLSPAGSAVSTGGESVYGAIRTLDDECDRLPEARTWQGQAHEAATGMFRRATSQASKFKSCTDGEASALEKGAHAIGAARQALLRTADEIDQGELQVTDQWVVLIKPARMSAEKAAQLQEQAKQDQTEINRLLLALGDADDATAAAIQAAAKDLGFQPPDRNSPFYGMKQGEIPPGDEVPNPGLPAGRVQQEMIRQQDMATTVRDSREYTDTDGHPHKTLTMLDGSRHEISQWGTSDPSVNDIYYDKNGKLISDTLSQQQYNGVKATTIKFGDGTTVAMTCTPDGKCTGGVTTADGRHGILPDEFFTHPALTTVGGALTGLEKQSERGIPMLTPKSVENIGKTAKFGGATLGVGTAIYDIVKAPTVREACVAVFSGTAGIYGGEVTGTALAGLAAPLSEVFPPAVPLAAMGGNMLGGWTFGYMGGIIGNVVCRP